MAQVTSTMEIWPAIDLRGGKCVRLRQGDYAQETVFGDDPAAMARHWVEQGARRLHLVDLDGARDGHAINRASIEAILACIDIPVQLGGGIRDEKTIDLWLELGVSRLVVGTRAIREPEWFREMCRGYPERLALGLDARDGFVATDGWRETSKTSAIELAKQFDDEPVAAVIYTDIAKDGMMAGPNIKALDEMRQAVSLPVVASGGVTTLADVKALAALPMPGCIIGRALYEGTLKLTDALDAAGDRHRP